MKMKKNIILGLFGILVSFGTLQAQAHISPLDYGLREATDGVGRYYALYTAHTEALYRGLEVSYEGIDTIDIELPPAWRSIPLGRHTDFGGVVLYVTNNVKHGSLFTMTAKAKPLKLDKALVDGLDFSSVPELAQGNHLLVLKDQTPWTERRGYGYKQYRSDIIMVRNGKGLNDPVAPWNTDSTSLQASYYDFEPDVISEVKNLTMHRTKNCTYRTSCLYLNGQHGVTISNIRVTTPRSKMIADGVFSVSNCADILFDHDTVEGTYSGYGRTRNYGYAFSMNNVYGASFIGVKADGNWGVFGTNNLSDTYLANCDINRFDIHCYGRDAWLVGCTLRQRQTQFSAMYGIVRFDSCRFIDCIPVRIRSSYNAYTPFDIVMQGCTFELTPRYHSLVNVMLLDTADSPRPELNPKCWPNLHVDGMTVVVPWTVGTMNLFHPTGTMSELQREFDYISNVDIKNLRMVRPGGSPVKIPLRLSSRKFKTKNELHYTVE